MTENWSRGAPGAAAIFTAVPIIRSAGLQTTSCPRQRQPVPDAMERYIRKFITYLEAERDASPHTIRNYLNDLEAFSRFAKDRSAAEIGRLDIRRYLAELKAHDYAKRSIARRMASLRSFFKFLCRDGYLKTNPLIAVSSPKLDRSLPRFLSVDQVIAGLERARANIKVDLPAPFSPSST